MRSLLPKFLVFAATALPIAAHADILDATLIDGSHTFTFTLPSPYTFPDQLHLVAIPTIYTTGTADGVNGTFKVPDLRNVVNEAPPRKREPRK